MIIQIIILPTSIRIQCWINELTDKWWFSFTSFWTWRWEATSSPMAASTSATRSRGLVKVSSRCSPSGRRETNGTRRGTRTARTTPCKSTTSASTISIYPTREIITGIKRMRPTLSTTTSHISNANQTPLHSTSVISNIYLRYGRCVTASTKGHPM